MIELFAGWGLIGFIVLIAVPRRFFKFKNKLSALLVLIILGPMAWVLLPFGLLKLHLCGSDDH